MTRRITLTMVAVVAGALLVASVVTLLLARQRPRHDMVRQAQNLATSIEDVDKPNVLRAVGGALRFEDQAVVTVGPASARPANLPKGVTRQDLDVERLRQGRTVSGTHGDLLYAAAPAGPGRGRHHCGACLGGGARRERPRVRPPAHRCRRRGPRRSGPPVGHR